MNIYIAIDDTDNLESPGSGELAEILSNKIRQAGLALQCSNITRHQLFYSSAIPYTSHNSSMCFSAHIPDAGYDEVIQFCQQFLVEFSAPGSDPGLCIVPDTPTLCRDTLVKFGFMAKETVLSKKEAYDVARQAGVHLSEHGGTGDGVIGALAGTGLRLHGSDGRFRGWLKFNEAHHMIDSSSLLAFPGVESIVDSSGNILPDSTPVYLTENRVKSVLRDHRQVIPVTVSDDASSPYWKTLTKAEIKMY